MFFRANSAHAHEVTSAKFLVLYHSKSAVKLRREITIFPSRPGLAPLVTNFPRPTMGGGTDSFMFSYMDGREKLMRIVSLNSENGGLCPTKREETLD